MRFRVAGDVFRGTGHDEVAALVAALGAEVDDPVGGLDDVEVVLDDHDRVSLVHQLVEHLKQPLHVLEVEARGRLVEQVERAARGALGELGRELHALRPKVAVLSQACPLLVPLVEEGWQQRPETMKIIRHYLRPLKLKKIDALILGCTHYPMLLKQFQSAAGKRVAVLDSAQIVAEKLEAYLKRHPEIETKLLKGNSHRFLVTDLTDIFTQNAQRWLGQEIILEKIVFPEPIHSYESKSISPNNTIFSENTGIRLCMK